MTLQAHHNGRAPLDPNSPTIKFTLEMNTALVEWVDRKALSWGYSRNQSIRSLYHEWVQIGKPALSTVRIVAKKQYVTFTAPQALMDQIGRDARENNQMRSRFMRSLIAWGMQRETAAA